MVGDSGWVRVCFGRYRLKWHATGSMGTAWAEKSWDERALSVYSSLLQPTMRAELIGHFEPCMTEIYLHIDARMADYMATHP